MTNEVFDEPDIDRLIRFALKHKRQSYQVMSGICARCHSPFYTYHGTVQFYCSKDCGHKAWGLSNRTRGDRYLRDGYVYVRDENHPRGKRSGGWVREHILVMERHIGRHLLRGENVHHKNGNRADNDISNLELWITHQPSGQRLSDRIESAAKLALLYPAEFNSATEQLRSHHAH